MSILFVAAVTLPLMVCRTPEFVEKDYTEKFPRVGASVQLIIHGNEADVFLQNLIDNGTIGVSEDIPGERTIQIWHSPNYDSQMIAVYIEGCLNSVFYLFPEDIKEALP